ncbi:MAG: DUF4154 domain-containing protein [Calditrichaeota bacterium]|nr:MAG: DUF4154 domain-containing protein [Calditrichota bacterium]
MGTRRPGSWSRAVLPALLLVVFSGLRPAAPGSEEVPSLLQAELLLKVLVTMLGGEANFNRSLSFWIVFDGHDPEQVERAQDFYEALLVKKSLLFPASNIQVDYCPAKRVRRGQVAAADGVFFILAGLEKTQPAVVSRLQTQGAMLLCESPDLVARGALFSVSVDSTEQASLTINAEAVAKAGLKLPPELIRLARIIRRIR